MSDYYAKAIPDVLKLLGTGKEGLTQIEVEKRISKYGYNDLKETAKISPIKIFLSQFTDFLIIILFAAMVVSYLAGEKLDAGVIGAILIVNGVLGFVQEYRAEKAIQALKKLASLQAVVLRDGKEVKIDAKNLVPGDIILLETGEKIPADSRVIESINLQAQEASLTGESLPIKKGVFIEKEGTSVADRRNMVFAGTIITAGRGKAVVTETGMKTEIGKIAEMIQEEGIKFTPLQTKLEHLSKFLGILTIIVCTIVFFAGILIGIDKIQMFMIAVSLAVAAIPEGLPAIVTISLAIGIQRMVKRNALIRRLPSVETLGSTTVICTDKTGTLTLNQMTVKKIFSNDKIITVSGSGYKPEGDFFYEGKYIHPKEIELLLRIGALCNNSRIDNNEVIGDPTEGCLIISAEKSGLKKEELDLKYPRIGELEFTSERKRMSTLNKVGGKNFVYCKGAPDIILDYCDRIYKNGKIERLSSLEKKNILKVNEAFARQALRVLGFAYKESGHLEENDLIFVGLQGMIDPPRDGVRDAIEKCRRAGIKVVMITGDFKMTAEAVAHDIGLHGKALDGKEIDKIKDLSEVVEDISIYARVDPMHKVKILEALKKKGHVVAMTGDGVNDAPAIKKADIGIAMGITGTDVAKEASDMILTDDNFVSIVNAIEEGRTIADNIKTFLVYLISGNYGELLCILTAILAGLPLPLLALQILWINILTETIPATSLVKEPPEPDIMTRSPRKNEKYILNLGDFLKMSLTTLLIALGTLFVFVYSLINSGWSYGVKIDLSNPAYSYALTMAFSTFVLFQIFNIFNCKTPRSVFFEELVNNKWLLFAVFITLGLQMAVIYTPVLNTIFSTVPLSVKDWILIIVVASSVLILGEIMKVFKKQIDRIFFENFVDKLKNKYSKKIA